MSIREPASTALRRGRFREAYDLHRTRSIEAESQHIVRAELLYYLGSSNEATKAAEQILRGKAVPADITSRCNALLAEDKWYNGDRAGAIVLYQRALKAAERSGEVALICVSALRLLERTCDDTGFDASIPLAQSARRFVARSADSQVLAQAHLTFGRLEAKAGNLVLARKHFDLARKLLTTDPNLHLSCSIDIDESVVLWIGGDIVGAVELAERGAIAASEIGWSKGRVASGANLACLYVCLGRLKDAHEQIELAALEPFSSLSFQLALSDTKARALILVDEFDKAEQILNEQIASLDNRPWYTLTAEHTHIRLLLQKGSHYEALERLSDAIQSARQAKLISLVSSFQLLRVDALTQAGVDEREIELPDDYAALGLPAGVVGSSCGAVGLALLRSGHTVKGGALLNRATRVLAETGDLIALPYRRELPNPSADLGAAPSLDRTVHLDSAAALLDLAGHPHILAREVFALVADAGCAETVALVAAGATGVRLIDAQGWSAADALSAVRAAKPDDLLTLGQHRDETWQLLARPRPELDHRCTLAAIRKLATTARALDAYRRDEKQRAALWPAEALDGDAESLWISEQSADLLSIARRIANAPLPVLLTGETGTGKEMLARVIHRASTRADKPLHPFNCTAVPREMLESQLFGYRKGSFTGADVNFPGVIRAAAGGTLFLDEIGDIGIDVQPKLLRFLEHQEVHPLGEPHPVKVDVRIIAATNANLDQFVAQGRFREDLLYRLNVMKLHLPPLRERREEIPPLVQYYIRKFADEQRKGLPTLSDETLEYLLLYPWPGNIRQLANEVRRMIALAEPDATLTPTLLSPEIQASRRTVPAPAVVEPEIRLRLDQRLPDAVEALEQSLVRRALERSHGRVEEAARLLGISRKGLFLKRRRWGLHVAS